MDENIEQQPGAIKMQWYRGERTNIDLRGGEPTDPHATVRLPGMATGIEIDPATPEQIDAVLTHGPAYNAMQDDFLANKFGLDPDVFGRVGIFVMDSDGKGGINSGKD